MLLRLQIRDFATISSLNVEFSAGMTVLTGETGAGKSILIDAIGLLLGDRADGQFVRSGRERADLVAEFDLQHAPHAQAWIKANDLDDPDDQRHCILRRTVAAAGRTRATINGSAVPVGTLRELGEQLIDIHGQHEHQLLLRSEVQRGLLDDFGQYPDVQARVRDAAQRCQDTRKRIAELQAQAARPPAELELLRYQVEELEKLELGSGSVEQLEQEHSLLSHAGELLSRGGALVERLGGDDECIADAIAHAEREARELERLYPQMSEFTAMLTEAGIQVQEAADGLRRALENTSMDPERLLSLEKRLEGLHAIARKHRVRIDELPAIETRLLRELQQADDAAEGLAALEVALGKELSAYRQLAAELSGLREKAAKRLSAATTEVCAELGMRDASIQMSLTTDTEAAPSVHGNDSVQISFSANPGQAAKPLAKVASGGELSRVSLAIQVIASRKRSLPVMIFDEVDAGVGGAVAQIVGEKLRELAAEPQVLCVTHLPQVAAQAHNQLRISKVVNAGETSSGIERLSGTERIEEIARMLGGVEITAQTRRHAKEMLQNGAARR